MKNIYLAVVYSFIILVVISCGKVAEAAPLTYQGDPRTVAPASSNVHDASNRAVPTMYNTNYETQYAPYASFMQSPYSQGGATMEYSGGADPYAASEVSPYSHYSPYIEVVGEGSTYTLGIDDVVTIIVRNQPDFSGRFVVDPEGNVQYNFVGDIDAVGKTKGELKEEITKRLKRFIRYPEVAVMISEYRSKSVYVFGYVGRPGKYAMKGDRITVKEAVVAAGLPRVDAALKRVYVIRPSDKTESGEVEKKKVNLKELLQKGNASEDFFLEPGDTIIVNQRYFDKFVNNFSRITGPLFQAAAVYELGFGGNDGGFLTGSSNSNN